LGNLFVMANTPDPRDFYQVSRLVLIPSLSSESFCRVAAEALLNGIPVLADNRGALPGTLSEAGFLFDIPQRYTPQTRLVPTAEVVGPWIDTILRLWDDAAFYEQERRRCLAAAEAWKPERLVPRFEEFFTRVIDDRARGRNGILGRAQQPEYSWRMASGPGGCAQPPASQGFTTQHRTRQLGESRPVRQTVRQENCASVVFLFHRRAQPCDDLCRPALGLGVADAELFRNLPSASSVPRCREGSFSKAAASRSRSSLAWVQAIGEASSVRHLPVKDPRISE
jgi:hypothetical protein